MIRPACEHEPEVNGHMPSTSSARFTYKVEIPDAELIEHFALLKRDLGCNRMTRGRILVQPSKARAIAAGIETLRI